MGNLLWGLRLSSASSPKEGGLTFPWLSWYRYPMPTPTGPDGLTLKQRKFALALPTAKSAADAARIAGYSSSFAQRASENGTKRNVMEAATAHIKAAAEEAGVDAVYVLKGLKEHREEARVLQQYAPANTALELIGKHLRMFGDDKPTPQGDTYNQVVLQGFTFEQLQELLGKMQSPHLKEEPKAILAPRKPKVRRKGKDTPS